MAGTAAALVAALALTPGAGAGGPTVPKPGTYSGAGAMVGDESYGMQVGFIFRADEVDVRILGFSLPNCSGFTSVPVTTIGANRFETSSSNANRSTLLKGRWVDAGKLRGKMVISEPPATNCGDPGTYTYKYSARRYGRP